MPKRSRQSLPNLQQMSQGLRQSATRAARLTAQIQTQVDELLTAVEQQDWVYAHRLASAVARISQIAGAEETRTAAEAVCLSIERSGDIGRIRSAASRLASRGSDAQHGDTHASKSRADETHTSTATSR